MDKESINYYLKRASGLLMKNDLHLMNKLHLMYRFVLYGDGHSLNTHVGLVHCSVCLLFPKTAFKKPKAVQKPLLR